MERTGPLRDRLALRALRLGVGDVVWEDVPSLKRSMCGAAAAGAALVVAAVASAAPGDPQKHLKRADQVYAKSILLRMSDLPAGRWKVEPTSFSEANPDCVVKRYSLSALTATGEAGFTYTQRSRAIESDARVFLTAAQAGRAFSILSSVGLGRCLGSAFAAEISATSSGVSAKVATVEPLSFTGLGAPARGVRVSLRLHGSASVASLHYVFMSVRHGRAVATFGLVRDNRAWARSVVRPVAAVTASRLAKR